MTYYSCFYFIFYLIINLFVNLFIFILFYIFIFFSYRINENINLPFKIVPIYNEYPRAANHDHGKIECIVKLKTIFEKILYAQNVVIKIPCPKNTIKVHTQNSLGKSKYEPEHGAVVWR